MPKKLVFARRSLEGIAENKDAERDLKRFRKHFKRGELVPESVWVMANTILAEKSRAMSFDSKRPYVECMKELLHREPHLSLGVGPYLRDREFTGIEFVEEEAHEDAT